MTTKLQELHHAVSAVDTLKGSHGWSPLPSTARQTTERLLEAARKVVIEHTVTQEIQQLLSGQEWDSATCEAIAFILREHGYPIREVEPTLAPIASPEVIAAFMEVQECYPDVESVVYDLEGRWCYRDSDGTQLTFGAEVSTDILGLGADAAPKPSVYFLVEG